MKVSELAPSIADHYKVILGDGQGLTHSGDFCDLVIARLCETYFILVPSILNKFGILLYRRFRDDILVAFNITAQGMDAPNNTFLAAFKRRAARVGYVVTPNEVGSSVPFLNATVQVVDKKLKISPYTKPGWHLSIPLCRTSAHQSHVHDSWPIASANSMTCLTSSLEEKLVTLQKFVSKFVQNSMTPPSRLLALLEKVREQIRLGADEAKVARSSLESFNCFSLLMIDSDDDADDGRVQACKMIANSQNRKPSILWVPLPFNIAWTKRLNVALSKFLADPWMSIHYRSASEGQEMPRLRFAWQLSDKNHEQTVRKITSLALVSEEDRKVELEKLRKLKLLAAGELSRRRRSNPYLNRLEAEADAAIADLIPVSNLFS